MQATLSRIRRVDELLVERKHLQCQLVQLKTLLSTHPATTAITTGKQQPLWCILSPLFFCFFFQSRLFFVPVYLVRIDCWRMLVYVAIGAASIVEPQGFSGGLPVLFLLRQIKMFCSDGADPHHLFPSLL